MVFVKTLCRVCGGNLALIGQYPGPRGAICRPCHNKDSAKRQREDQRARSLGLRMWRYAKRRADLRGILFDLAPETLIAALESGRCAVTGLAFNRSGRSGSGRGGPFSPTIDRKNPAFGYTDANVQVVCWIYNRAKGPDTHEAVLALAEALRNAGG